MKPLYLFITCFLLSNFCISQNINLSSFASGFSQPIEIANSGTPNDTRLFVVEQSGIIKILNANGSINTTPFLDISAIVGSGGERGLLGLAFAPNYSTSGRFYVNYTDDSSTSQPNTIIARYTVSTNPDIANITGTTLLSYKQPFSNHNGGKLAFGPDGFLYIASGDGGSGGDPGDRAQNTTSLFGKLLRIDVSGNSYTIPNTNPYASSPNGPNDPRPEIYAIGLRNPWKFSFDKITGDLWIADVGQKGFEEINNVSGSGTPGDNYGWRCYEGNNHIFDDSRNCPAGGFNTTVAPVAEYPHVGSGCSGSITGGYLYRGSMLPNFSNKYFFADYCSRNIGILTYNAPNWSLAFQTPNILERWTTFGEDINGELYIAGGSTIYKIQDANLSVSKNDISDFKLYPNPSKTEVTIDLTDNFANIENISITNIQGQLVKIIEVPKQQTIKIPILNYNNGLYFIVITTNNDSKAIKKLIIQ